MNLHRMICLIFIFASPIHAQYSNVISTLPFGARAISMQGAFTAMSNDYSCSYHNPAGIATIHSMTFGFMHSTMSMNRSINFLSVIYPQSIKHFWGLSAGSYGIGNIEARSENTIVPDYTFACNYQQVWLSYAYRPLRYLSIGTNVKWLSGRLNRASGVGMGFDVGLRLKLTRRCTIGILAQDLETGMNWDTGTIERFNSIFRAGITLAPRKNMLVNISMQQFNNQYKWSFGTEFRLLRIIKLRAGLRNSQLGYGTGMSLPLTKKMFVLFNYAYSSDPVFIRQYFHTFDISVQRF